MNIELPVQCKGLKLTDREKIFCWVIVELTKKMKTVKWSQYALILHKRDVNHILKKIELSGFKNLHSIFNIGILNENTLSVSWKKPIKMNLSGPGAKRPDSYIDQIEDPEFFVMYAYLLGRMVGDSNIFSDEPKTLYTVKQSTPVNVPIHYLYKSYYQDELYGDE